MERSLTDQELNAIVEKCEVGFRSTSWKRRKWSAFKTALHSGHVQRFRESLMETKSTLTLALLHQWYVYDHFIASEAILFVLIDSQLYASPSAETHGLNGNKFIHTIVRLQLHSHGKPKYDMPQMDRSNRVCARQAYYFSSKQRTTWTQSHV
jgi:hypothetical protein